MSCKEEGILPDQHAADTDGLLARPMQEIGNSASHAWVLNWVLGSALSVALMFAIATCVYHFVEEWSIMESLYFAVVTTTTVGYGEYAPTTKGSRIFTIFYIILGMFIWAIMMATIQFHTLGSMFYQPTKARYRALLVPSVCVVLFLITYAISSKYIDDLSVLDAFYFAIASLSTVGYGDLLPSTDMSRNINIFMLLVGTALYALMLSSLVTYVVSSMQRAYCKKLFRHCVTPERLLRMDTNGSGDISRAEFMEALMLETRQVDPAIIAEINSAFEYLVTQGGTVAQNSLPNATRPVVPLDIILSHHRPTANLLASGYGDL